jgi:glycosyltransferase involved in cell wall biosynthesis
MPRVLFLTDSLSNGGAERQLALHVKYLPKEWEKRVLSMSRGPFESIIHNYGVSVYVRERARRFDISPALFVWRVINTWSPDIVHSWGWMSTLAAIPICKAKHIPLIDGTVRMGARPPRRALHQWLGLLLADGIITNSTAGLNAWKIPASRGRVIPNGFDPERLKLCRSWNIIKNDTFTVGMIGRMSFEKDFSTFISAADYIVNYTSSEIDFIALGDGNQRQMLLQQAEFMIEGGRAQFPPSRIEAIPIIDHFNIGVLMSHPKLHAEGCSNAIMEYMACGLPVICSTGGGNHELVLDGKTGFLIPPGDWKALVDKILYLYGHQDIAKRMGEEGHQRIIDHFSVEEMVRETLNYYARLVGTS